MVIPFTGFPNKAAAHVALETVRKWLEINADKVSILAWLKCKGSVLYMTLYLASCFVGLVSKLSSLPSVFDCLQYFKKTPWCMQQSKSGSSEGLKQPFVTLWLPLLLVSWCYCVSFTGWSSDFLCVSERWLQDLSTASLLLLPSWDLWWKWRYSPA